MPAPDIVELLGFAGVDLVLIDCEHGMEDEAMLAEHLRAADAAGIDAVVRVRSSTAARIGGALDAGAAGIVVPHVSSASAAAAIVDMSRYSPEGSRSLAVTTRAGRHAALSGEEHLRRSNERTAVIVQIEDTQGASVAADIASTAGIDAIWIGPNDLADSLGHPGQPNHKTVRAVVAQIFSDVRPTGATMFWLDNTEEGFHRATELGATVHLTTLHSLLHRSLVDEAARFRRCFPGATT